MTGVEATGASVRRLLVLVSAIVLVETMFFAAVTPLLPEYVDRFDLSKSAAGVLSAAYPIGVLLGSIPSGVLVARIGARGGVLLGLAALAACSVAFGLAGNVVVLDSARFLQGVAGACAWTGGLAWLINAAPTERRGELLGVALGAAIGGSLLGPVLGGLASWIGPAAAFSGVGAVSLGLAAASAATPRPPAEAQQSPRALVRAVADPAVRRAIWLVMLPALLFGTLGVLTPLRLDDLGVGAFAIGAVFFASAAIEGALSPVLGRLSDRVGRLPPLRAGLAASAVMALVLPWSPNAPVTAAVVVVSGIAFGTFWAPAFSLLADASEATGLGHGYGFALMNLAWGPGQAIGALAGSALSDATSDTVPYALLAATCLVTLARVRRNPADEITRAAGRSGPSPAP